MVIQAKNMHQFEGIQALILKVTLPAMPLKTWALSVPSYVIPSWERTRKLVPHYVSFIPFFTV